MTFPWPPEIASAFEQARTSDAPLSDRLSIIASVVAQQFPEFTDIAQAFVDRLEQARAGAKAPAVGETMPAFVLPDQEGHLTSLKQLLDDGPLVVAFVRGHWCPYCQLNVRALAEIEDRVRPARIVAVLPETQHYSRLLQEECGAHFSFLTDVGAAYALSLNLAIWIDQTFSHVIAASGCDVPLYNGTHSWILPIPSVFVVKPDGTIAARHIDPDYRQRMEMDELLRCVQRIL